MNQKTTTVGILTLLFTGVLAAFYWLDFFPSKYKVKMGIMLTIWLLQLLSLLWWIKSATATMEGGLGILFWVLGTAFALMSLLYCIGSSTPNNDRELVKDLVHKGKRVELYHLYRHDHTALELFYATDGLLAKRYFQDHCTIKNIELEGDRLLIQNSLQAEQLVLDLKAMEVVPPALSNQ